MKPINIAVSTPFGRRGQHWSCRKNSQGGIHTGDDFSCAQGTAIVAPIPGTIRHRNYGSAFGPNQFAISPSPGQPFANGEVFFAHTLDRLPDGTEVQAGQQVARVGALGNATGPHLHFEFHPNAKNVWNCDVVSDPQPVYDWQPSGTTPPPSGGGGTTPPPSGGTPTYLSKLKYGQRDSDSVKNLQVALNAHKLQGGQTLPVTGNYLDETDEEVRLCQNQHGFGNDPPKQSYVGEKQAAHLGLPDIRP